jgi:hypothetical protein
VKFWGGRRKNTRIYTVEPIVPGGPPTRTKRTLVPVYDPSGTKGVGLQTRTKGLLVPVGGSTRD